MYIHAPSLSTNAFTIHCSWELTTQAVIELVFCVSILEGLGDERCAVKGNTFKADMKSPSSQIYAHTL